MQLHCRYHPTRVPVLMCGNCSNTVCPDCVPFWPARGMPRCVTCRSEMEALGISEYVKPFWQCFDRFFKFPLKTENLVFILVSILLFMFVPVPDAKELVSPLGFVYRIIVWILFPSFVVAYFSAVAVKASDGNPEAPNISEAWTDGGFLVFFKAMIIIVVFSMAKGFSGSFLGAGFELFLTLFATLAIPASLILLFLEREISAAVNPGRIIGLMQAVGWPYLFLWGLVMMLFSGPDVVMSLPESFLKSIIFPTLALLANLYFGLVLFHLLGYVVYQYHYELGVALPREEIEGLRMTRSPQKAAILESELLIMEGKYHSAIHLLKRFIDDIESDDPKQDQVWLKLYELAQTVCKDRESVEIIEDYIHHLLTKDQSFKVVAILRNLLQKTPQFKFCDFSSPDPIEKFLRDEKEVELLIQLV